MWAAFGVSGDVAELDSEATDGIPAEARRTSPVLPQQVFHRYHSEHAMLRYIRRLADRDLALDRTMIPLGSCTMKLNATSEMLPITWPEFAELHPFAPDDEWHGYRQLIDELEAMLVAITGLRRGEPAAERRQPGRVRRAAGDPRVPPGRTASRSARSA